MNLLIVDVETTGLDPAVDVIVEAAYVNYSVEHREIVAMRSEVFAGTQTGCEEIHGISAELRADLSAVPEMSYQNVVSDISEVLEDAILVAHQASFESSFLSWIRRPWVCSRHHIEWPKRVKPGCSLVELAVAHRVPVVSAHRALDDCRLLADIFRTYEPDDLAGMIRVAQEPRAVYEALVSFNSKDLAKDAGFGWQPDQKAWTRELRVSKAEQGGYGFGFGLRPFKPEV